MSSIVNRLWFVCLVAILAASPAQAQERDPNTDQDPDTIPDRLKLPGIWRGTLEGKNINWVFDYAKKGGLLMSTGGTRTSPRLVVLWEGTYVLDDKKPGHLTMRRPEFHDVSATYELKKELAGIKWKWTMRLTLQGQDKDRTVTMDLTKDN